MQPSTHGIKVVWSGRFGDVAIRPDVTGGQGINKHAARVAYNGANPIPNFKKIVRLSH